MPLVDLWWPTSELQSIDSLLAHQWTIGGIPLGEPLVEYQWIDTGGPLVVTSEMSSIVPPVARRWPISGILSDVLWCPTNGMPPVDLWWPTSCLPKIWLPPIQCWWTTKPLVLWWQNLTVEPPVASHLQPYYWWPAGACYLGSLDTLPEQ